MDTEEIEMMRGDGGHGNGRSTKHNNDNSLLRRGHFRYLPLSIKDKRYLSADGLLTVSQKDSNIPQTSSPHPRKRQSLRYVEPNPESKRIAKPALQHQTSDPSDKRKEEDNITDLIEMGLHVDQQSLLLFSVIVNDDLDSLKKLYTTRRLIALDRLGNTPLHIATQSGSQSGNLSVLRWLLKHSKIPVLEKNIKGETCAFTAVRQNNLKALKTIVHGGGHTKALTIVCERDNNNMTILHVATLSEKYEIVRWLSETFGKTLISMKNSHDQMALHFAAVKGHRRILQILGKYCRLIINDKDKLGASALYYAAHGGYLDCVRHLVLHCGADLNLANDEGIPPLMVAVQAGHTDVVKFILDRCDVEDVMHQSNDGATVFHMAAANGNVDILKLLVANHVSRDTLNIRDNKGASAAHDAADQGHTACLELLIQNGLNIHQPDENGDTPYFLALRSSNPEIVAFAKSQTDGEIYNPEEFANEYDVMRTPRDQITIREQKGAVTAQIQNWEEILSHPIATNVPQNKTDRSSNKRKHDRSIDILSRIKQLHVSKPGQRTNSKSHNHSTKPMLTAEITLSDKHGHSRRYGDHERHLFLQKHRPAPMTLPFSSDQSSYDEYDDVHLRDSEAFGDELPPNMYHAERDYMRAQSQPNSPRSTLPEHVMIKQAKSYDDILAAASTSNLEENQEQSQSMKHLLGNNATPTRETRDKRPSPLAEAVNTAWFNRSRTVQFQTHYRHHVKVEEKQESSPLNLDYSKHGQPIVLNNDFQRNSNESTLKASNVASVREMGGRRPSDGDGYLTQSTVSLLRQHSIETIQEESNRTSASSAVYRIMRSQQTSRAMDNNQVSYTNETHPNERENSYKLGMEINPYSSYISHRDDPKDYDDVYSQLPDHVPHSQKKYPAPLPPVPKSARVESAHYSRDLPPLLPPRPHALPRYHITDLFEDTLSNSSMPVEPPPPPTTIFIPETPPPPPPPPLPPSPPPPLPPAVRTPYKAKKHSHFKSLAEIIRENKVKVDKDGNPIKPPRRKRSEKRKSREPAGNLHQSDRILRMGRILEKQGALEPFATSLGRESSFCSDEGSAHQYNPRARSRSDSRPNSPLGRSPSPTNNNAMQKFSYLPDGHLIRPKLRHIERGSIRKARANARHQGDRRSHRSRAPRKPSFQYQRSSLEMGEYKRRSHEDNDRSVTYPQETRREPEGEENEPQAEVKYDEDDYKTLKDTLERRLSKQRNLPIPSFQRAKQIEDSVNTPSELELFFAKRRERQDAKNAVLDPEQ